MTVVLALRKNDDRLTSKAICWWSNSIYSHCELVVDGVSYSSSAMDGGVRSKVIDMTPDKWDFIELPWIDPVDVTSYFIRTDSYKYGWLGLITNQMFNLGRSDPDTTFCSQWCAAAMGIPNPAQYSPGSLNALSIFINKTLGA